jgi:hypothetical protein
MSPVRGAEPTVVTNKHKRLILPRAVSRRFARYAYAYYAAASTAEANVVAVKALKHMRLLYPGRLRLFDIKRMFAEIDDREQGEDDELG